MSVAAHLRSFALSLTSPTILFPNILTAALLAVMKISTAISVGALVFSGPLAPFLSTGIGLFLWGTALGSVLVAAGSGFKAVIAGPRSAQAPILAAMAAAIVLTMEGQSGEAIVVTVVVAFLVTTILIGVVLFLLGWGKMGTLARYIPYPVMGGFFAGLGYLLVKGGIVVSVGPIASLEEPISFFTWDAITHLAPAFLFAILLFTIQRRISHWLLMPAYLSIILILFYAALFATGTTLEMAVADHWFPVIDTQHTNFFPIITFDQLALVDWAAILPQSSAILVMVLMSIIMLLLDTSGIEIILDQDMDPNHELKAAGLANILTGFATGPLVIQSAVDTAFTFKLGGTRFLMILIHALFILAVMYIGPAPIAYLPTAILGGLLIYIGIDFLTKWVWESAKKLPFTDFMIICGILSVVAAYGILEGVAVGIILALLLFVHSYSQLSVIKSSLTGLEHVSNVDRNFKEREYLNTHGESLHIFILQGFLFFGTSSRLIDDVRQLLNDPVREKVKYLILDFQRVNALDTSAVNSFAKLMQICTKDKIALIFTGCSDDISQRLSDNFLKSTSSSSTVKLFKELDEGVTWCDDDLLQSYDGEDDENDPVQLLTQLLQNSSAADALAPYFQQISYRGGQNLFLQGDPGDALYLILQGSISITLDLSNGDTFHVRTMRSGAILGEMALYTGSPRSATARVDEDSIFFKLDQKSYETINRHWPTESALFHTFIVRMMSERLERANREITALSR